jgi:hypothetical protein
MTLDLYAAATLVLTIRGLYLAHLAGPDLPLLTRILITGPGILGLILFGRLLCGILGVTELDLVGVVLLAAAYIVTPISAYERKQRNHARRSDVT